MQVVDLGGVNTYSMLKHQRSPENQAEWQHNADFNPETLVRACLQHLDLNEALLSALAWASPL